MVSTSQKWPSRNFDSTSLLAKVNIYSESWCAIDLVPQAGIAQYQCSTGIFAWDQCLNVLYFGGGDAISFQMGF